MPQAKSNNRGFARLAGAVGLMLAAAACTNATAGDPAPVTIPLETLPEVVSTTSTSTTTAAPTPTTTTMAERAPGEVPASTVGRPWGSVEGLVMFRGNPTRTFYGTGPLPQRPELLWRFPDAAMCGNSPVGGEDKLWCGSG